MDLRKIGVVLIFVGIFISIAFIDNSRIFVPALTITVLGFFVTVVGFVSEVRKRKIINDRLNSDIDTILQPLISKYSALNKKYLLDYDGDEYKNKRFELNRSLEMEISENLPYLESREVKKIVIQFSKEQDKIN